MTLVAASGPLFFTVATNVNDVPSTGLSAGNVVLVTCTSAVAKGLIDTPLIDQSSFTNVQDREVVAEPGFVAPAPVFSLAVFTFQRWV